MSETVEQEIQRKGLTAPRVTPADVEAAILEAHFINAGDAAVTAKAIAAHKAGQANVELAVHSSLQLLTLCVLMLRNGFTVVGKSACASRENYDQAVGERVALEDAKRQCWPLLGYALRNAMQPHGEAQA